MIEAKVILPDSREVLFRSFDVATYWVSELSGAPLLCQVIDLR